MRFTILTTGSRGDVQPYVALGVGLRARSHQVCVATHADFESFVRDNGLDFYPLEQGAQALQASDTGNHMLQSGSNAFAFLSDYTRLRRPILQQLLLNCWRACRGSDVILATNADLLLAQAVAEREHLPVVWTSLQPVAPSRFHANCLFRTCASWVPGSSIYNLATHAIAGWGMWLLLGPALNKARRDVLGLPPLPIFGPIASYLDPRLSLDAYSPLVAPPPPDWNVRHHVTGFWFLKTDPWQPPKELVDFLDAGPPPICIGFGSMHDRDAMRVTKIVIRAVEQSGQRAVLLTGWGGLRRMPASERLFWADVLPHAWLFPRTAGVVHHGGAGSTAAGLCAGVPSLVVPFMSDQPFWGRRVYELGVGPSPIPHSRLSVEGLVKCIRQMMDDEDMRRRAAELGKRIRTEDGVGRAVDLLERYFQLPTRQFPIASTWMAIRTFASNLRNPKKSKGIRESAVASA